MEKKPQNKQPAYPGITNRIKELKAEIVQHRQLRAQHLQEANNHERAILSKAGAVVELEKLEKEDK